jgi:hypothetical protein
LNNPIFERPFVLMIFVISLYNIRTQLT